MNLELTESSQAAVSGGGLVVESLAAQGCERVFCVPGESYLAVLDALVGSGIAVTNARHEGAAAMMADAWGKLTGRPGVAMVTRGPGAMNAAHGVHVAMQDSTPMILLIGQVARDMRDREAFQEMEYRHVFASFTKEVAEVGSAARLPEYLARAYATALAGRPGPVVLALPEDVLSERARAVVPRPTAPSASAPEPSALSHLQTLLEQATSPIAIAGGSGWSEQAVADLARFSEAWRLPVACSFRRQTLFDNRHLHYAGDVGIGINPDLAARIEGADLVLLLNARLGEMPSQGYRLLEVPQPRQTLVHIHAAAAEIGRIYRPTLGIAAAPPSAMAALATLRPSAEPAWEGEAEAAHRAYLSWSTPPDAIPGPLQMGRIMTWLDERLPEDAIITNGAGNYATWVHRFRRFRRFGTQLAPTSGSMGYGLPAAIAAKLRHPQRLVLCFAGDGCFSMVMGEFATAVQEAAHIVVLVVDNGMYGTIRMHQERHFPGRVSATDLVNPDFAALARACGGHGETVRCTEDFAPAFDAAVASGRPALLHLHLDPRAITPDRTLQEVAESAGTAP